MTKGISMMRLTTQNVALLSDDDIDENAPKLTPKQHIINRRGAFKWLPGIFNYLSSSSSYHYSYCYCCYLF